MQQVEIEITIQIEIVKRACVLFVAFYSSYEMLSSQAQAISLSCNPPCNPDCFLPPKKQNCNMFIISDIRGIKERSLTYHPGGMSEISRGLREAIPPDSSASTSLIPEGLHKINAQMKYPVSSLRDEKEAGGFTFRGYRFSQPPANLYNPYRDLRNPYTVATMDKLCYCFFQEKRRVAE